MNDPGFDFAALSFDKQYWLEIKVGDEVMTPRQRITSVGYAIRAEKAEQIQNYKPEELLDRKNHTGTQSPNTISPQGANSGLDADTLDGKHLSEIISGAGEMGFCFGVQSGERVSAKFKKVKGLNYIRVNFSVSTVNVSDCAGFVVTFSCGAITATTDTRGDPVTSPLTLDVSSLEDNKIYTINGSISTFGYWGKSCNGTPQFNQVIFTHE